MQTNLENDMETRAMFYCLAWRFGALGLSLGFGDLISYVLGFRFMRTGQARV